MDTDRIKQIQAQTEYKDSTIIYQMLLQVWNEVALEYKHTKWKPISTAPRDGTFILLLMESGYKSTPYRVTLAKFCKAHKFDGEYDYRWRDHANDSVHEEYGKIIAWTEWSIPTIEFEPTKGLYKYLELGDIVRKNDEILNKKRNKWIKITDKELNMLQTITGGTVTYTETSPKIRRRI